MTILSEDKELDEIKKIIRSLLLSSKQGLTLTELCSEYNTITSKVIPYRSRGFTSAIDFIKDMPDVVRPIFHRDGSMLLVGIADQNTAHIRALVHGQKTSDSGSRLYSSQQLLLNATKRTVSSFIQGRLHSIIKEYPDGIDITTFDASYVKEYGKRINPLMQGYTTLRLLLAECCEILTVRIKGETCMIYPVSESEIEPQQVKHSVTSRGNITNVLKKEVFSVLMKYNHNKGLFVSQFMAEYKSLYNKDIDLLQLGYTSVVEFMSKLNDIVFIKRVTINGDWFLFPKMYIIENNKIIRTNYQYTTISAGSKNEQIDICISYIKTPSLFWFQLTTHLQAFYVLMEDMNQFYDCDDKLEYNLPMDSVVMGQPCAALYSDSRWYRGIIQNIFSDKVQVFFVDYGDNLEIDSSSLKILRSDFLFLPLQAIPGKLYTSCSKGEWSNEANDIFFELTQNKELQSTIINVRKLVTLEMINSDNCNLSHVMSKEFIECSSSEKIQDSCTESSCDETEIKSELETAECMDVKCLCIFRDCILHIFRHNDTPYLISAEISDLFWDGDVLKHMLRLKNIKLNAETLNYDENKDLFATLAHYNVYGLLDLDSGKVKQSITCYELIDLSMIFSVFVSVFPNAHDLICKEIDSWKCNMSDYWRKNDDVVVVKLPEEQRVDTLTRIKALEGKRKELFSSVMMNHGATGIMKEIMKINQEIDELKLLE